MDGDWPEFSIPDVGQEPEPQHTEAGVTSGSTPPAAAPPSPAGTQATDAEPNAAGEMVPKYRMDQLNEQKRQLEETTQKLLAILEQQTARERDVRLPPPEPDEEAERKQRILQQLIDLDPRIQRMLSLGEKADVLERLLEDQTARSQNEKRQWDQHATRTLTTLHDAYASAAMGKGKLGKDLPPDTRQGLTDNFVAWVMQDQNGDRTRRYDEKDPALVQEFISDWQRRYVEPWRRQTAAGQVQAARRTATLPRGGSTSSSLGTPPAKPADDDEDAVFRRGWEATKQALDQSM